MIKLRILTPKTLATPLLSWRPGGYARASTETLFWLLLRALLQALTVILLARLLGNTDYGLFVAALAVVGFFVPLASMGLGAVILRDGAREPTALTRLLVSSLKLWVYSALSASLAAALVAWIALPANETAFWVLLLFALGEIAPTSGVELLARRQQASHNMRRFGAIMSGFILARLVALVPYVLITQPDGPGWMVVYALTNLGYLGGLMWWLRPDWSDHRDHQPRLWREGVPFVVGAVSFRVQSELNKPLLAHSTYSDAGVFSIAQRAMEMASLPLLAMQEALWSRLFSESDSHHRLRLTRMVMLTLGLGLGTLLTIAAPYLPWLVGPGFEATANTLQWLAWLPILQVLRNIGNAQLMLVRQSRRLIRVYMIGGLTGAALSLVLIPRFGLLGAVLAAYGAELVLIVAQKIEIVMSK